MATTAQHPNVERARRNYEATAAGDLGVLRAQMSDEIVWHIFGNSPVSGDYKGKDAVFGFLGQIMQLSGGTFRIEIHDILANENHTTALVTERAERNGKKWESRAVHVVHPDSAGRIKEFWAFQEDTAAADAFWS